MIILAGTPIGNLADASVRLRETFETATVIAAEDTRKTIQLMRLLEIENRPELISFNDHNESSRAEELLKRAETEDIVVVSDAGMPTVSDPGYRLVQRALAANIKVTSIPGPSAVTTALAVSGLPSDRFIFEGFFPRKEKQQLELVQSLQNEPRTTIFFESPVRIPKTLQLFAEHLSENRTVVVCRELTKMYEEVRRGSPQELYEWARGGVRGEIVLLVGPAEKQEHDIETVLQELFARVEEGARMKDVSRDLAKKTGMSAKIIYEKALEIKGTK